MTRIPLLCLLCLIGPTIAIAQPVSEPILKAELESNVAVPGQVLTLDVTILVPTWMPKPPEFPTFELPDVSVRLPEGSSRPAMENIDGETWSGVTRAYQLSPMVVGRFMIPPQTVTVTYADPETRAPIVATMRMGELVFEGRAPAGAEDLDPFIAAESLTLEQTIEGDPLDLEPGGAFTRVVTARVSGASPIFLPPLVPLLEAEGLAVYPKEPVFSERANRGRMSGERIEAVTYVAEAGGRYAAAPVRLHWWNLRTNEIEVTEIPAFEIVSRGLPPITPSTLDPRELRPWILGGSFLVLMAGVGARWLWPRFVQWRRRRSERRLASEAFAFDRVADALRARRFGDTLRAVEVWSVRLPLVSESERLHLFELLEPLGALLYGPGQNTVAPATWSEALAALRTARRNCLVKGRIRGSEHALPSLNPTRQTSHLVQADALS
jgi:hypothetical protein